MSDLDRFVALYKSFGIELKPEAKTEYGKEIIVVELRADDPKFDGYTGFYSDVEFDKGGTFVRQGFGE